MTSNFKVPIWHEIVITKIPFKQQERRLFNRMACLISEVNTSYFFEAQYVQYHQFSWYDMYKNILLFYHKTQISFDPYHTGSKIFGLSKYGNIELKGVGKSK